MVTDAIEQNGWSEASQDASSIASLIWLEHADASDGLAPVQTVTRIDAFLQLCKKAPLAKNLNAWLTELPDDFGFSPRTWVLPYDTADLKDAMAALRFPMQVDPQQ